MHLVKKPPKRPQREEEVYLLLGRAVQVLDQLIPEATTFCSMLALTKAIRSNLETREAALELASARGPEAA